MAACLSPSISRVMSLQIYIYSSKALDSLVDKLPTSLPFLKHCAATHAIFRNSLHAQPLDEQLKTWHPGGLHPAYFPAHAKGSQLNAFKSLCMQEDTTKDIFDAVSIEHPLDQKLTKCHDTHSSPAKIALTEAFSYSWGLLGTALMIRQWCHYWYVLHALHGCPGWFTNNIRPSCHCPVLCPRPGNSISTSISRTLWGWACYTPGFAMYVLFSLIQSIFFNSMASSHFTPHSIWWKWMAQTTSPLLVRCRH